MALAPTSTHFLTSTTMVTYDPIHNIAQNTSHSPTSQLITRLTNNEHNSQESLESSRDSEKSVSYKVSYSAKSVSYMNLFFEIVTFFSCKGD